LVVITQPLQEFAHALRCSIRAVWRDSHDGLFLAALDSASNVVLKEFLGRLLFHDRTNLAKRATQRRIADSAPLCVS
jgi:hypothetical protein